MQPAINRTSAGSVVLVSGWVCAMLTAKGWVFCTTMPAIYFVPASPQRCLFCFISGLGMENIGGIFVVLICGLIVAIFMAMLEFLWSLRHSEQSEVGPESVPRG